MPFIEIPSGGAVDDATADMFSKARERAGYLPNMTKIFAGRADVMGAWEGMLAAIKGHMELRRYELVTLAAARELRSSYCMLAHGSLLVSRFFTADELRAIVEDAADAPLDVTDRVVMRFAAQVVRDATAISPADIDALKACGLTDAEVFDVAATAAVRCFFSKTLDALGARPDAAYGAIEPALRAALTVGRPIDDAAA